ncbi:UNVERIFIED_CONTAM: hypothetical protein K2H54_000249 [Gekko kuhli]
MAVLQQAQEYSVMDGRLVGLRVEEEQLAVHAARGQGSQVAGDERCKLLDRVELPDNMRLAIRARGLQLANRIRREQDDDLRYVRTVKADEFGRLRLLQDEEKRNERPWHDPAGSHGGAGGVRHRRAGGVEDRQRAPLRLNYLEQKTLATWVVENQLVQQKLEASGPVTAGGRGRADGGARPGAARGAHQRRVAKRKEARLSELQLAFSVLERDITQMVPRSGRIDGENNKRVGWRLKDHKLERLSYLYPDPVIGTEPRIQPMLERVTALRLYFYDKGTWKEEWTQRTCCLTGWRWSWIWMTTVPSVASS